MTLANRRWLGACALASFIAANFAFVHGFREGVANTADDTDRVCTKWWFGGDTQRLNDAKKFMCKGK